MRWRRLSSQWIRGRVSVFPSSLFGLLRRGVVPRPPSLPPSDLLSPSVFLRGCVFSLVVRALCVWEYVRVLNILVRSFHIFPRAFAYVVLLLYCLLFCLDYVAILYDLACVALGAECFYSILSWRLDYVTILSVFACVVVWGTYLILRV